MRVSDEIKSAWLRFIIGKDPWDHAFEGTAASFNLDAVAYGPLAQSRGWTEARLERMERLKKVDFLRFVEIATTVFP